MSRRRRFRAICNTALGNISGITFGATRLWGNVHRPGAVVSAGSCRRLRYVPAASSSPPRRPPPATSSWSSSQHRVAAVVVAGPSLPSPALAAQPCTRPLARCRPSPPRPPSSRLSPLRRRVIAAASSSRQSSASASRPSRSRPFERRRRAPARRRPSSPPPLLPSSVVVVVVVEAVIAAFAVAIVAAVIVVNTLGHGSRCRCGRSRGVVVSVIISVLGRCRSCSPLSVAGCHRLVVTVVRRPSPPLSSLILASTSSPLSSPVVVLSHPAAGIAELGLGCYTCVVVGSPWLCSPPRCGRGRRRRVVVVLAAAGWQCFDVGASRGTEHDKT